MINFDVAVVVPAAGKGERFAGASPKQYCQFLGKPLFMHCLEAFINTDSVKKICIVSDRKESVEHLLKGKSEKIMVAAGGASRHASIKNGLDALRSLDTFFRVVVVHDGARPVVPEQLLKDLILEAGRVGAAGATRPLTSTVLRTGADERVVMCLDRASHVASETPQAFDFGTLCLAYEKATPQDMEHGTECLDLVLKYGGVRGKLLPGPDTLWKVTDKKDCYASIARLRELSTSVLILAEEETDIVFALRKYLLGKVNGLTIQTLKSNLARSSPKYNALVCVNCASFDQTVMHQQLTRNLDPDSEGLVIHVVTKKPGEKYAGPLEDLIQNCRTFQENLEKLMRSVVFIYVSPPLEHDRLMRLINSVILNDWDLFSGQVLFLENSSPISSAIFSKCAT